MGTGTPSYSDYAVSQSSDNEEASFPIDIANLVAGTNVIAVEIHNRPSSSDISFDFSLVVQPHDPSVIQNGAVWKYNDGVSGAPPSGWAATGNAFDDSAWLSGQASLGYGDSDVQTVISFGSSSSSKPIGTYYRRTLQGYALANSVGASLRSCVTTFTGSLVADDGAVVYVNGNEVFRYNMPTGTIAHSTRATSASLPERRVNQFTFPASLLPDGTVTIAAEVHQASPSSSDLYFELSIVPNLCGCSGVSSTTYSVARPPYLQQLSSNGVILRWDSNVVASASVQYGLAVDQLVNDANGVCTVGFTRKHSVLLANLQADTIYYYRLVGDTAGTIFNFRTQPLPANINSFVLWFLADAGTANSYQRAVRDRFAAAYPSGPDVMLFGGDNAYNDGTEMEYEVAVFQTYANFLNKVSVWSTLGNHDARSAFSDTLTGPHFDSFDFPRSGEANRPGAGLASGTEAYYSFDHGLAHIVCLDSEDSDVGSSGPMATWLAQDIANARTAGQQWLLAFWHHPPYTKGSHNSDSESKLITMRQVFLPILEQGGVDVVMSGHSHVYERSVLLDSHYGSSTTYNSASHRVQSGSGAPATPYTKPSGLSPHNGTVYIVAGSAGALSSSSALNHPAMQVSLGVRGSVVLEFGQTATHNTLEGKFLTSANTIADNFVIQKPLPI